jgi:hypothetical protein
MPNKNPPKTSLRPKARPKGRMLREDEGSTRDPSGKNISEQDTQFFMNGGMAKKKKMMNGGMAKKKMMMGGQANMSPMMGGMPNNSPMMGGMPNNSGMMNGGMVDQGYKDGGAVRRGDVRDNPKRGKIY